MSRLHWPAQPTVSIVTPSYNQGAYIEATIKSVLCQDYPHIQYIVMDACSTDNTQAILQQYSPWIDALIIAKDKGQSDALNRGFQKATGQILAYLNSDDVYADETVVSQMVTAFIDNPQTDVISGRRIRINEHGGYIDTQPHFSVDAAILEQVCYISQECTFWTRNIYDKAGGFIDDTLRFAMDYDLWLRFIKADAQWLTLDKSIGLFRWQANQKTQTQLEMVCNPEVWRLQSRQGRMPLCFEEAGAANELVYFGCSPDVLPDAYLFNEKVWKAVEKFKSSLYRGLTFDQWALAASIHRPQLHQAFS